MGTIHQIVKDLMHIHDERNHPSEYKSEEHIFWCMYLIIWSSLYLSQLNYSTLTTVLWRKMRWHLWRKKCPPLFGGTTRNHGLAFEEIVNQFKANGFGGPVQFVVVVGYLDSPMPNLKMMKNTENIELIITNNFPIKLFFYFGELFVSLM